MEEFTAYTVERIKGKKQLVFNISCDVVFNSFKTLFNDFEEYCDNLCDWYNIYDKEHLKADIEDAYHSQKITN